ncbi:MAG TPA: POTRA domain-containing protein, partial [Chitinophagaceae bacterium]|nr:POTRA domain-containing protein [Chitinophagaceae bacterium]
MRENRIYCLWLLLALASCYCGYSQAPGSSDSLLKKSPADTLPTGQATTRFVVRSIYIEGNKKTKQEFIFREIPFKTGESYILQELVKKFEVARKQLMNTTLFHEVIVALKSFEGYNVDVSVQVRERWYIFPVPYFKPVDRNLNQWLVEQKASLTRVNYGAKLLYNNVTGRNDKLRLWIIGGYTKQLSFSYDRLYIDRKLRWGFNFSFAMGKNKEVNYNTINDKQAFLKEDSYLRNFLTVSAEATYRRAIKTRHRFGIMFTREVVSDTVVKLNPIYFPAARKSISFPEIYYKMSYYDLDYIPYPTKGYAAELFVGKKGFSKNINLWQLSANGTGLWPISKKTFFTLIAYGAIKLPFEQPYVTQHMLGYSDAFLQGYEYYVIDGVLAGYIKTALTLKLFN